MGAPQRERLFDESEYGRYNVAEIVHLGGTALNGRPESDEPEPDTEEVDE